MSVKLGMVGCGRISHAHGIAAQRIGAGVRFSACADISEKAARGFAEAYGAEHFYTDYVEMIRKEKFDGIVFATWPAQHREHLQKAIELGARYILCEKALAMNGKEATEIWDIAREAGTTIVEAFMYTHHPVTARMDKLVNRPESGPVDTIRASFHLFRKAPTEGPLVWRDRKETGGSVPFDRTCYPVNACARYANALPVRVFASGEVNSRLDVITRLYGEIVYENGCVAFVESSNGAVFSQELQITCANRVYRLSSPFTTPGNATIYEYWSPKSHHVRISSHKIQSPLPLQDDLASFYAYKVQLGNFAKTIRNKRKPSPSLTDSVVNSYTLDALVRSVQERRVVDIEIPERIRTAFHGQRHGG